MIQLTSHMRILLCREPINFNKGIDGTAAVCRQSLASDPMTGALFVFHNRKGTMLRILAFDGQGFWLMTKRLSSGKFRVPRVFEEGKVSRSLEVIELQTMLWGGDIRSAAFPGFWRKIS